MQREGLVSFVRMTRCVVCSQVTNLGEVLPICASCLRKNQEETEQILKTAHQWRQFLFELPSTIPQAEQGVKCKTCSNECIIASGDLGYCGLRTNANGRLEGRVNASTALMHYYFDPHITNCCGAYFCPGGTGVGYPKWAKTPSPEYGFTNLAVFFYGCGLDCLFCQNVSHKRISQGTLVTIDSFIDVISQNEKISCVCYFGGSPEPQLPFTINVLKACQAQFKNRILRQCFEMNGHGNPSLVKKMGKLVEESGGIIKFDLKAYSEPIYKALCGVSKRPSFDNFTMLAENFEFENKDYPSLMATTLLVPHYVDEFEVGQIARFLKELNEPAIEYSLLVFHPRHLMKDLPVTPLRQVQRCYDAVKRELGKPPNVGNLGLLAGTLKL
jgi:pyruvate formate lyase activating enzyme